MALKGDIRIIKNNSYATSSRLAYAAEPSIPRHYQVYELGKIQNSRKISSFAKADVSAVTNRRADFGRIHGEP